MTDMLKLFQEIMVQNNICFNIVGLSYNSGFKLSDEVIAIISENKYFSGGSRHLNLVKDFLPDNYQWIDIKGSMDNLIQDYEKINRNIVVFASGDPFFYGIVATIKRIKPAANVKVFPWFNSIQLLCHKHTISYSNLITVSVHGRDWDELDIALIKDEPLIGVLTDNIKNPSAIAMRMLEFNFSNYSMVVGEELEGKDERVSTLNIEEAGESTFSNLNCVLLIQKCKRNRFFGIPDEQFECLPGRPNMITKSHIRMLSLAALDLLNKNTLWDIGFCTGSLSIEAKIQFPHLKIYSYEIRPECEILMANNAKKFSAPGITVHIENFLDLDVRQLTQPDSVLIGGHGQKVEEIMNKIDKYLAHHGRVVMNAVQESSIVAFNNAAQKLNYTLLPSVYLKVNDYNAITILIALKN